MLYILNRNLTRSFRSLPLCGKVHEIRYKKRTHGTRQALSHAAFFLKMTADGAGGEARTDVRVIFVFSCAIVVTGL